MFLFCFVLFVLFVTTKQHPEIYQIKINVNFDPIDVH